MVDRKLRAKGQLRWVCYRQAVAANIPVQAGMQDASLAEIAEKVTGNCSIRQSLHCRRQVGC